MAIRRRRVKQSLLAIIPSEPEVEHSAICSIDGEPWPCAHRAREGRIAMIRYIRVVCLACGKPRNAFTSLSIGEGFDGQPVYFHWRKRCRPVAEQWWNENVKPVADIDYQRGLSVLS